VSELQERLRDLRFWMGPIDGGFGPVTEQAVLAFQKANGIQVDGLVGPETRAALADPVVPRPRTTTGRAMEVDKEKQLLYAVLDGEVQWVFHTSTGTELAYAHPDGYTALADTPPGTHTVYYEVDGWQDGELGPLYRPKYFHHDGIAVHGYGSVPPYPASHGCVRVSFAAVDFIWDQGLMPLESTVLVYGETPAA
jgi:N-acetylmuramoyl-L-alanine amidase